MTKGLKFCYIPFSRKEILEKLIESISVKFLTVPLPERKENKKRLRKDLKLVFNDFAQKSYQSLLNALSISQDSEANCTALGFVLNS